jgi:RecA/RadA recombinase
MIIKLSHLPLRPSTLSLLTRKGFHSTADVDQSFSFGISNFASELGASNDGDKSSSSNNSLSIQDVMKIKYEIENAVKSAMNVNTTSNSSNTGGSRSSRHNVPQTAAQILSSHYQSSSSSSSSSSTTRPIISFVKSIDTLLGGGFHTKQLIEIAGLPGVGKTQLAMQLCVDTTLPQAFGGNSSTSRTTPSNSRSSSDENGTDSGSDLGLCHSIYIDSEGSFSPERCYDMANALVTHISHSAKKRKRHQQNQNIDMNNNNNYNRIIQNYDADTILDCIHVFRVLDETCQTATIYSLPKYLKHMKEQGKDVKLIVIDSIAFHYRVSFWCTVQYVACMFLFRSYSVEI